MIKLKQLLAETAYSGSVPPQGTPVVSAIDLTKLETQLRNAELVTQGLQSQIDGVTADREIQKAEKLAFETERLIASFETKIKEQCQSLKRFKPSSQRNLCKTYYENLQLLNAQLLNLKAGITPSSEESEEESDGESSFKRKKLSPEAKTTMWVSIAASILGLLQTIKLIFPGKTPGTEAPGTEATDGGLG
jgi:hypothetical protein